MGVTSIPAFSGVVNEYPYASNRGPLQPGGPRHFSVALYYLKEALVAGVLYLEPD